VTAFAENQRTGQALGSAVTFAALFAGEPDHVIAPSPAVSANLSDPEALATFFLVRR
jgi:hypothetical protein